MLDHNRGVLNPTTIHTSIRITATKKRLTRRPCRACQVLKLFRLLPPKISHSTIRNTTLPCLCRVQRPTAQPAISHWSVTTTTSITILCTTTSPNTITTTPPTCTTTTIIFTTPRWAAADIMRVHHQLVALVVVAPTRCPRRHCPTTHFHIPE